MCDGRHRRVGRIKPSLKLEICLVGSGEHSGGNFSVEERHGVGRSGGRETSEKGVALEQN